MANRTGKGGFKEHPENKNKSGQRNKEAVAFSRSLRELIVREGERSLTLDGKRHRKVELMVRQLWAKAIAGEAWACNIIMDRTEGRVTERAEITGANGGPIETKDVSELTDNERVVRIATILDAARARRDGPPIGGVQQA